MRISRKRSKYKRPETQKRHRINQYIKTPEVRLIDETGQNIGVISTEKAQAMARERELDLVEVSPLAQPPVVKIVDFSKLRYQEEKERRKEKAKQKKIEVKGIRLTLKIGRHDIETRINQAEKFLADDDKVKIELILKGREKQHRDLAKNIVADFIKNIEEKMPIKKEQDLKLQGGRLSAIISKK